MKIHPFIFSHSLCDQVIEKSQIFTVKCKYIIKYKVRIKSIVLKEEFGCDTQYFGTKAGFLWVFFHIDADMVPSINIKN